MTQPIDLAQENYRAGRLREAEAICRQVLAAQPANAPALHLLALIAYRVGQFQIALDLAGRAIAVQLENAEFRNTLGTIYQRLDRLDEAASAYGQAISIDPAYVIARLNLGSVYQLQGRLDEATEQFQQSLTLAPNDPMLQFNIGYLELLRGGDLLTGLRKMEPFRHLTRSNPRTRHRPQWDGSDLNGRSILIWAEKGCGDTIHFSRYLPALQQRGGKVILTCQPELVRLMQQSFPEVRVVPHDDATPPPQFDVHHPLMSIPLVLSPSPGTPGEGRGEGISKPYLRADPEQISRWRQRLPTGSFNVGLVWAANPTFRNDRYRSTRLEAFAPLAQVDGVNFVSLQKGVASEQSKSPPDGMNLLDLTSELNDFADTAALIQALDLVVTVDTSVAHLAGALGKPVWVLLGLVPDWRWMLGRSDSPWYPTMRLFRQPRIGDWQTPINEIAQALRSLRMTPS